MTRKYNLIILVIIFISGILLISDVNGFAKSSARSTHKHRHHVTKSVRQTSSKLVLRSSCALVEDQETSEILVQKNASAVVPIASITKLMTAMVVLDADVDLQEEIIIDSQDVDTLRHSRSRLPIGTNLTRQEALLLALMSSENRAAQALSRTYPGGQVAFVAAMNAKARSLNLTHTHFSDPTGLSGQNVSSACELAKMVNAAYQYPLIRAMTTCEETMIQSDRGKLAFKNTNHLLRCPQWQIGLSKTGFIDEAGRCLVMQAQVAQRPVLIVLLDAPGTMTRFGDANRIRNWMERTSPPPVASKG
jgi:D-alanyl-D-alanine endopeptidase (penicillin-binding protein 7)